jgi:hypothetical protein
MVKGTLDIGRYWSKERWILNDNGQRNVGYWTILVKGTLDIGRYWSKEHWILDDNRNIYSKPTTTFTNGATRLIQLSTFW